MSEMDEDQGKRDNAGKQGARLSSSGDGPDTVRILPDSSPQDARAKTPDDEEEWRVERPVVRSGTLYTRVPAEPPPHEAAASRAIEPAPQMREVVSTGERSIQAQESATSQQVTHVHKGPSGCAIMAVTFSLLLLSCAALGFFAFRSGMDGLGKLGGFLNPFGGFGLVTTTTTTIDTSRPTVIDRVRAMSKLETVHYELEKVVTGKSSGPLPDFLTSDKILLVAHGEVAAGVDLEKLRPGDVTVVSDTVTIRMPQAEILFSTLDNDKTYVYDRQTGIFNKPDPNLETEIRRVAEQEILKTAMEDDILGKAQRNAQDVLRTLITGLGYKDVRFTEGP